MYPYLGADARTYTQYRDSSTWLPLTVTPGGRYGMEPVAGAGDLPVPPGDGLWGQEAIPDLPPAPFPLTGAGEAPASPAPPTDDTATPRARTTKPGSKNAASAAPEG